MRRLLFNVHLYLALIAGVFVVILGLTGAIMAFEPELDHVLHAKLSYVTPRQHRLSLAQLSAAVQQVFPGERIGGYLLSNSPDIAAGVSTKRGVVAVDPYTGAVLGVRQGGQDFLGWVHQLHLRLTIRNKADTGKDIVKWAGIAMMILLLSGIYLWWPVKRISIETGARGRRFWFDVHNAIGIFSLVFLLTLTFTGLMIGFEESTVPMFYRLTGSEASKAPPLPPPPPGAKPITPDQAMQIAAAAIPGTFPFQIVMPGPKGAYQIRSRFPEDLTPGGRSRVIVDQYTGNVLYAEGSRTAPAGTRMVIVNRAIHTGDIFGIPSKTLMSLASLMAVIQVFSGALMWWKRTRAMSKVKANTAGSGRGPG
uniref:Propeptide, PepSY amd peptidase M4 n=1 Tax=Solibacter usitatus (strain Ellin6076) TaxID=234267 RepID=Q020P0_SOLUE